MGKPIAPSGLALLGRFLVGQVESARPYAEVGFGLMMYYSLVNQIRAGLRKCAAPVDSEVLPDTRLKSTPHEQTRCRKGFSVEVCFYHKLGWQLPLQLGDRDRPDKIFDPGKVWPLSHDE